MLMTLPSYSLTNVHYDASWIESKTTVGGTDAAQIAPKRRYTTGPYCHTHNGKDQCGERIHKRTTCNGRARTFLYNCPFSAPWPPDCPPDVDTKGTGRVCGRRMC